MPEIIHRPVNRVKENCNWLLQWRGNVTSQIGQDGILQRIFSIIGEGTKFCVEFGAWDGKFLSNTWNLIVNRNWSGVLIEGDPQKFEALETTHPAGRVKTLNRVVGWEGSDALDKILDESDAPQNPDLVSIDVDGNDWHIWKSLVDHRPRVVLIEFNPTIP